MDGADWILIYNLVGQLRESLFVASCLLRAL
jgi:hypothetical protein